MSSTPSPTQSTSVPERTTLYSTSLAFVTGVVGFLSALFFILFFYQVQSREPFTGELFRNTRFAWLHLTGHLLRALTTGSVFLALFRYLGAVKRFSTESPDFVDEFVNSHNQVWFRIAVLFTVLIAFGTFYVAYLWIDHFRPSPYQP